MAINRKPRRSASAKVAKPDGTQASDAEPAAGEASPQVDETVEPAVGSEPVTADAAGTVAAEPIAAVARISQRSSATSSTQPPVLEVTAESPVTSPVSTVDKPHLQAEPPAEPLIAQGSQTMSQEEIKVDLKPVKAKADEKKAVVVAQSPSLSIWESPVMPSDVEVIGTLQIAGVRPVAASHLGIFATLLNDRPIEASGLQVFDQLPGGSPIFLSEFHAVEGLDLPGGRPVMASDPGLMHASMLSGGRPIFSNEIDNSSLLMGYID